MPKMIKTIEELIATNLKRDGYWFVFNTEYNDVMAFHKSKPSDFDGFWLDANFTNLDTRQAFLDFMAENLPTVKTYEVLDWVSVDTMLWTYLGSIAVDVHKGDVAYQILSTKYGHPEDDPTDNRLVFWKMDYGMAVKAHEKRVNFWDEELSEDE